MKSYVIDASVVAKWFRPEEHREFALKLLGDEYELHAPDFSRLELDSLLCKWIRRGLITLADGREIRARFRLYPVKFYSLWPLTDQAFAVANRARCSFYDGLYLALAMSLNFPAVTADRRLYNVLKTGDYSKHVLWIEEAE